MNRNVKVSVVIPLFNAEKFVKSTLECILNQTYKGIEVIVIDDGSTDSSLSIVEKFRDNRLKILKNKKNQGIAYTRNRAISVASGEYIALMDDDDLAPKDRIEKEVKFMEQHSDVDIVLGHMLEIDEKDEVSSHVMYSFLNPLYLKARQLLGNCIPNGSTLIRKCFLDSKEITYRDNMYGAEDYRFWVECLVNGANFGIIDDVLLYHRIHANNACSLAMEYHSEERRKVISETQRIALSKSGFMLSEEQYAVLFEAYKEEKAELKSREEIKNLYKILKEISIQAVTLKKDNATEIGIMCRKSFGDKVGQAFFLWQ